VLRSKKRSILNFSTESKITCTHIVIVKAKHKISENQNTRVVADAMKLIDCKKNLTSLINVEIK